MPFHKHVIHTEIPEVNDSVTDGSRNKTEHVIHTEIADVNDSVTDGSRSKSEHVIHTEICEVNDSVINGSRNKTEFDDGLFANQRIVNVMRHLSQLIGISDDIFEAIEYECRNIFERTKKLRIKIQRCQKIVDNLDAKTVNVPVSSLSASQTTNHHFQSRDVEKIDKASIFFSFPQPRAVINLRALAHGPSPPVVIPCGMVAPEAQGFTEVVPSSNPSTHIYCKPVMVKEVCKSYTNVDDVERSTQNKSMNANMKVPSSVVAIDVSGQPFSRMSSFRRSLIHVDFLIRRKKKKDKRRNTVTEGDVKDIKDAFHNIAIEDYQNKMPNTISSYQQIIAETKNTYNSKVHEIQNDEHSEEQNNNAANVKLKKSNSKSGENQNMLEGKVENCTVNRDGTKCELRLKEQESLRQPSKRKPKSNIPISTVSAAMNVAVEMRQCNGVKANIPVLNGTINNIKQSNLEQEYSLQENERTSNSSLFTDDDTSEASWKTYKKRLQEKCISLTSKRTMNENQKNKEIEASSSTSSESISLQEKIRVVGNSTESETFFISSDESEDDLPDINHFPENCGSSTSLNTASGGSLNSLLSETGAEMTSSTGTLTSIGHEQVLNTPPPPPPMILSATLKEKDIIEKISQSPSLRDDINASQEQKHVKTGNKKSPKQLKSSKATKPPKVDLLTMQKNTENSKNIFTSLVSLKTKEKDKGKIKKEIDKKKNITALHQPTFDMYGHNSPPKLKQIPTFIKENTTSVIQCEEKSHMKSFLVSEGSKNVKQLSNYKTSEKSNNEPNCNIGYISHTQFSDISKKKQNQSIANIPPKYEHQVTVTPVQRFTDIENKNIYNKGLCFKENYINPLKLNSETTSGRSYSVSTEAPIYVPKIQRPQTPNVLSQERSKLAARVILDFDGKVIYSTNSLDRKHYCTGPTINMYDSVQRISEPHFKASQSYKKSNYELPRENQQNCENCKRLGYNLKKDSPHGYVHNCSSNVPFNQNRVINEHYAENEQHVSRQMHNCKVMSTFSESMQNSVPKRIISRPNSFAGNFSSDVYLHSRSNNLIPDPNISGLPMQETMLTKHNVNLHSKHMESMNNSLSEDRFNAPSNSFRSSPSSETSCGNIFNKSPQSTMSTEDLFAVIHNYKKRMNIKTDSDISLASSSRSSSPSYHRQSSSKGTLAETGFLSPRSQIYLETSGDRRSWADFRPVDNIFSQRKSLASDRLGPTKPTSMHDFKMLLLQARSSSSQISGPRKSAVEMLKVPLDQNSLEKIKSPLVPLTRNSISFPIPNLSPELNFHNGHSTVPFKRGNRVRTSLQSRYIMYPPIFEDCSEDSENCNDMGNKSIDITTGENTKDKNVKWATNINNRRTKPEDYSCDNENNILP